MSGGTGPTTVVDSGRQAERTRLAWRRTTLAATVLTLLALRPALAAPGLALRTTVLILVVGGWLLLAWASWRRTTALATTRPRPMRAAAPITTYVTVVVSGIGVLLVAVEASY